MLAALIAGFNGALWPAQLFCYAAALAIVVGSVRRWSRWRRAVFGRGIGILLAAATAASALLFQLHTFALINFMAPAYAILFFLQAGLCLWTGGVRGAVVPRWQSGVNGWVAAVLIAYALVGYPILVGVLGTSLAHTRVVGLDPGATAVFTLGVLLLAEGRTPLHSAFVPLAWSLIAGASAWHLGIAEELALPFFAAAAIFALWQKTRRPRPRPIDAVSPT